MVGKQTIAIIVASGIGTLACAGFVYLYQQGVLPRFDSAKESPGGGTAPSGPEKASPQTALSPEAQPATKPKASSTAQPAEPTAVPSFDVVVIDPSGEGVIAGRAAPGWQVNVQSGGTSVAAATADAQGEWSAVLDKPLPAGDQTLSLKITSPDGTRALSSQQKVRVAVGSATKAAATPAETASASISPKPESPAPPQANEQSAVPPKEQPASAEVEATTPAITPGTEQSQSGPAGPKLVFKTVDYADTGSSAGSVSITGKSDPGSMIKIYSDNEPLATVRADRDGSWSVDAEKKLGTGQHDFRAERIDATTGATSDQATVSIERLVPKPPEVAAVETTTGRPSPASPVGTQSNLRAKDIYTVRRGDTLWAIAKQYFGSGLRYPTIFEDNREIIKNPDLIHPEQQVKVPTQ